MGPEDHPKRSYTATIETYDAMGTKMDEVLWSIEATSDQLAVRAGIELAREIQEGMKEDIRATEGMQATLVKLLDGENNEVFKGIRKP